MLNQSAARIWRHARPAWRAGAAMVQQDSSARMLASASALHRGAPGPWGPLVVLPSQQFRQAHSAADEPGYRNQPEPQGQQQEQEQQQEQQQQQQQSHQRRQQRQKRHHHKANISVEEEAYLELLDRAHQGEKNWAVARDILKELTTPGSHGLTPNIATALTDVFVAQGRPAECLETLKCAREQGVRPRIHAYSNTIAACYKELEYAKALRVFEIMRSDGYVPQRVTYSRALSSALKANQHELVLEIFDDMLSNRVEPNIVTYNNILNSCARVGDAHSAMGVMRAINERNLEMTQSSYHSLAICAGKTGNWEIARDAFEGLKANGFTPAMTMYNSVISACAKGRQWDAVIAVYNEIPDDMKDMVQQAYLSAVLMAFARSSDPADNRKTHELFAKHKEMGHMLNGFAYNAVMTAFMANKETDQVLALAQQMKDEAVPWDSLTYQNVILAHFKAGDISTAEKMLNKHAKHMEHSTACYRVLIQYYAETKNDTHVACRLSMQMMQYNRRLSRLDWHVALEHSLKLGNKALYWNFRKWMEVRAPRIISEVPEHLMLPRDEDLGKK